MISLEAAPNLRETRTIQVPQHAQTAPQGEKPGFHLSLSMGRGTKEEAVKR
jgi:hypothetical protein